MKSYKEVMRLINDTQNRCKGITKYKMLCEIREPGETDFKCKEGDVLVCLLDVPKKEKKIIVSNESDSFDPTDFMGVDPFICLTMESGVDYIKAGDVLHLDPDRVKGSVKGIVLNGAIASIIPFHVVLGINKEYSLK